MARRRTIDPTDAAFWEAEAARRERNRRHGISPNLRLAVALRCGLVCVYCGRKAKIVWLGYRPWIVDETAEITKNHNAYARGLAFPRKLVFQIDHRIPVYFAGTNDQENLLLACCACNHRKGTKFDYRGVDHGGA